MTADALLPIFFRWLHVMAATLAVGGVFFMRFILPAGLKLLDPEPRQAVFLKCRRIFKMVIHTAILLFIISGIYNAIGNWGAYKVSRPMSHAMFGVHLLLALVVFGIALYVLAGKEPPAKHRQLMLTNFVLLIFVVLAASTLKWVREHPSVNASLQTVIKP